MGNNRSKAKGRRDSGSFVQVPHAILESPKYFRLRGWSVKLLMDLYSQYKGNNNGDFSMAWKLMKNKGWYSKDTMYRARKELFDYGFIVQTRQGGSHNCNLYGVTWRAIDDCDGKLDIPSSPVALGYWRQEWSPKLESAPQIRTIAAR